MCRLTKHWRESSDSEVKGKADTSRNRSLGEEFGKLIKRGSFWLSGSSQSEISAGPNTPDNSESQYLQFLESQHLPRIVIQVLFCPSLPNIRVSGPLCLLVHACLAHLQLRLLDCLTFRCVLLLHAGSLVEMRLMPCCQPSKTVKQADLKSCSSQ